MAPWAGSTSRRAWRPLKPTKSTGACMRRWAAGPSRAHWCSTGARLVELLYVTERAVDLAMDPEITGSDLRNPVGEPGEGVGVVEAARGTLIHHYELDGEGVVKKVNLIVATTNNYADICMSVRDAARGLIKGGNVDQGLLNMVEMAFKAYDPCFGCSTHSLPGQAPLKVNVYDAGKRLLQTVQRG
jgi:F420-non-reducing hydrogenase large subunit